jgi:hypothetical protein
LAKPSSVPHLRIGSAPCCWLVLSVELASFRLLLVVLLLLLVLGAAAGL